MRSLSIAFYFFAAMIAGIYVIGALSSREHEVTIQSVFSRPSAEEIWQTVSDFENLPQWKKHLTSVKKLDPRNGNDVWEENYEGKVFILETVEWQPPRVLARRILNDNLPYGGIWRFEVRPLADGRTALLITEDGFVDNPFFRFAAKFMLGYGATIGGFMLEYAKKFGEKPEIEIVRR